MSQPPPIRNHHPCSWDRVLKMVAEWRDYMIATTKPRTVEMSDCGRVFDALTADMAARDAAGERKYGTRLQPHNGRDSLVDAYEEALDACVYLANYDAEVGHENHHGLSLQAVRLAFSIRCRIYGRDGR
jgi:hypothetical protein